jgi:hypothetical protein
VSKVLNHTRPIVNQREVQWAYSAPGLSSPNHKHWTVPGSPAFQTAQFWRSAVFREPMYFLGKVPTDRSGRERSKRSDSMIRRSHYQLDDGSDRPVVGLRSSASFPSRQCTRTHGHRIEFRTLFGMQQPSDCEESHLIQTMIRRTGTDHTIRNTLFSLSSVLWIARDTGRRPFA